jgi:hypothetical protein
MAEKCFSPTSVPQNPTCPEKARLLKRCAMAESIYYHVIQLMVWHTGTLKEPNPDVLRDFGKAARKVVEDTRDALARHTGKHGCQE